MPNVVKRSISFSAENWKEIEQSASVEQKTIAQVVNERLSYFRRLSAGMKEIEHWEAENGSFTRAEIAEAERLLGYTKARDQPTDTHAA